MATSKRVKGITVEINGSTTGLDKALEKVNSRINETSRSLRDVERLLKLDPGNTELIAQKQRLLKEEVSKTTEKLESLKEAQKQAKEQLENGDLGQDKYDALQREIIDTENELKRLREEAASTNSVIAKLDATGSKLESAGGSIKSAGQSMMGATYAIGAGAGVAAAKYAEVDKTMTLINQTMKNNEEQAKMLNDAMSEAAANSTFGMADAANASLNFARAGLDAEQAAAALAPAMNLAAGEGGNLDTVSGGLVATINGFHDEFENAGKYADVFASACNNSALDVDSLSNSMSVAAPIFSAAGYNVNDAALYLGTMANNGIEANKAANSLKTGIARLVSPAKDGAAKMEELGISVKNSDGSMKDSITVQKELHDAFAGLSESEQIAAASAIFGKNQMSPWLALINTAPDEVSDLKMELDGAGLSTDDFANKLSESGMSVDGMKEALAKLGVSSEAFDESLKSSDGNAQQFAENLWEACNSGVGFEDVVSALGGDLDSLQGVMDNTSGTTEMMADAMMSGFGGSIESLKSGVDVLMTNLGRLLAEYLSPIIAKVNEAVTWLNSLDDAQKQQIIKIAAIIAAIGPLLIVIGTVVGKVGTAMKGISSLMGAFGKLKVALASGEGALGSLGTALSSIGAGPIIAVVAAVGILIAAFKTLWDNNEEFRTRITEIWTGIQETVGGFIDGLKERLEGVGITFESVTSALSTLWDGFCNLMAPVFEGAFSAVASILQIACDTILGIVDIFIGIFTGNWEQVWTGVKEVFGAIWEEIKGIFGPILEGLKELLILAWTAIKDKTTEVFSAVHDFFAEKWGAIKDKASEIGTAIHDFFAEKWEAIKDKASEILTAIHDFFAEKWDAIHDKVTDVVDTVRDKIESGIQTAKDTVSGILDAIHDKFSEIFEGAKDIVSGAIDFIQGLFDFDWHLPDISLPHFSIEGEFSLNPPSIPSIGVEWYSKAMNRAAVLSSASIFGYNSRTNRLLGGGEAGREVVSGEAHLYQMIGNVVDARLNALGAQFDRMNAMMDKYMPALVRGQNKPVVLDSGATIGGIGKGMNRKFNEFAERDKWQ